jgi:hypothetical protein
MAFNFYLICLISSRASCYSLALSKPDVYIDLQISQHFSTLRKEGKKLAQDFTSVYHRERILETSTLSCNEEEEDITKPPKR